VNVRIFTEKKISNLTSDNNRFSALRRFRIIGITEGISFILLIFIGMPLKYGMGLFLPVKLLGWMHGILFILYVIILLHTAWVAHWSWVKISKAFILSLVPFGTFFLDIELRKEEKMI
jgi:integral membrane protein